MSDKILYGEERGPADIGKLWKDAVFLLLKPNAHGGIDHYMLSLRAVALAAGLLLNLAPPCFAQGPATPIPDPAAGARPPIFEFKSYDLGRITWYASADLPPESPVETIRQRGTPTTPTVTLRSAIHGGTGILFCFVQLPDPLPENCSGRITIGDIDGNDEAFWNGKLIGSTSGWGIAERRPRMYNVNKVTLKPGVNVFALRMSGPGGRPTFGVKSKTLTFCLTPQVEAPVSPPADIPTSSTPTIDVAAARAEILAADPAVSSSLLQRKRPSFGRFGEFEHNGLPAVSEVSPTRIATRQGPAFDVLLDRVDKVDVVRGKDEPGIDGWHKLSSVSGQARTQPLSYTLRQHVLYPGAVMNLTAGSVVELRVRFPEKRGQVFPLSEEEKKLVFGREAPDLAVYGFFPAGSANTPAILAATGLSVNITQASAHVDVSLARKNGSAADARVYIFYPLGLYRIEAPTEPKSLSDLVTAVRPGSDPGDLLRQWFRVGLYEPVGTDEYFAPINDDKYIRVFQAGRYRPAPGVDLGGPLLMRPPQVDYVKQALGYGIGSEPTSSTGVLAFSGDMHYSTAINAASTTSTIPPDQRIHIISYDLPVPVVQERAMLALAGQDPLVNILRRYALSDLGSTTSLTAVDALYKSRTQGYQAFSYLNQNQHKMLGENSAATVMAALGGHFWNHKVEPFSGLGYWYTSFVQGPYFKKYDQDWGNGLALYGLATFIKYTGNWKVPADHWEAVERIFSWFTVTDDWEWMRASNSPHGHGTGSGDCQNATYAAALSYAKLARGAGRTSDYHYGLYTLARTALIGLNRFAYNDFAASNGCKGDHSRVLGFHEGKGFLEGELDGYPWNVTSNISGNGIQTENHDFYMANAQDALRNFEQIFEKNYPHWMDGTHEYGEETLYRGNSGYITLPHIYLRARLGGDSFATLNEYLERARSNDYLWWLAPPVIAEVINKKADGVVVTEWENAAFLGGSIEELEEDDDRRRLTVRLVNRTDQPNNISIRLPRKPHRFDINGGPVPLTDSSFENGELRLKLRRPGENVVTVIYSEK